MVFHLNKLESPSPKEVLCQFLLKIGPVILEKKILKVFSLFCNYLLLDKGVVLHLKNLNPLHPRMLCVKVSFNWPSGSREEDF